MLRHELFRNYIAYLTTIFNNYLKDSSGKCRCILMVTMPNLDSLNFHQNKIAKPLINNVNEINKSDNDKIPIYQKKFFLKKNSIIRTLSYFENLKKKFNLISN